MTDLTVRRPPFDFAAPVPVVWQPDNPRFSHAGNMLSFIAIGFEKMIVEAVREAEPHFTDPEVAAEADAFLRQEAQHANAHRQHVTALIRRYPGLRETLEEITAAYDRMTGTKSLEFRLAYIANLEATFTPTFRFLLDNEDIMFRPGDDRVASLLLWHLVEEVEHRSSALLIYNTVVGRRLYRLRVLPAVIRHTMGTLAPIYIRGMSAHVPAADHGLDIDLMAVSSPIRVRLSRLRGRNRFRTEMPPPMLENVCRRDKRRALHGLILSQNPFFDPAGEAIPSFAGQWFDRYERGDDVTHWYGSRGPVG